MRIFIRSVTGRTTTIEVNSSDTIGQVKDKLESLEQGSREQQCLFFAGKKLLEDLTLAYYNIQEESTLSLTLRSLPNASTTPAAATVSSDKEEIEAIISAWTAEGKAGNFDPDIEIIDPLAHYTRLSLLEDDVVKRSEWYRDFLRGTRTSPFVDVHAIIYFEPDGRPISVLNSIRTTYRIICRVLTSFDKLRDEGFCQEFYSILMETTEESVAEIVRVPRAILENLKVSMEVTTELLYDRNQQREDVDGPLLESIEQACGSVLDTLHVKRLEIPQSIETSLALCRSIALLLDLGLVSYVGSHASNFDIAYLNIDTKSFGYDGGVANSLRFSCMKRRLACLDGFLDNDKVWTFQCLLERYAQPAIEYSKPPMFILTRIAEFADIWGPVWSIPAPPDKSHIWIKHHNVSKGIICRVEGGQPRNDGAIRCHWYDYDSYERLQSSSLVPCSTPQLLAMNDLLLIGTRLRENTACKYTLDDFEADYGPSLGVLGPERSFWELEERQIGVSFNKAIGVQISGTQKRHPQTSLKQSIVNRWKLAPQTANPAVLNHYLGVEISHCTGNARRIPIKHIFLMPPVWKMLELQFPGWTETPWGCEFVTALLSDEREAIFDVWTEFASCRVQFGAVVSYVLELLNKTGSRGNAIVAAFLNNRQESSVTLKRQGNEWSCLLSDSHLTATFAAINNVCIDFHTPDHSTSVCGRMQAYTVLDTWIAVNEIRTPSIQLVFNYLYGTERRPASSQAALPERTLQHQRATCAERMLPMLVPSRIKLHPHGQVLQTLNKPADEALLMIPSSSAAIAGAQLLSSVRESAIHSGVEAQDPTSRGGKQYKVFLRASTKSCGGMKNPRGRPATETIQPRVMIEQDVPLSDADALDQILEKIDIHGSDVAEPAGRTLVMLPEPQRDNGSKSSRLHETPIGRSLPTHRNQDVESTVTASTINTDTAKLPNDHRPELFWTRKRQLFSLFGRSRR